MRYKALYAVGPPRPAKTHTGSVHILHVFMSICGICRNHRGCAYICRVCPYIAFFCIFRRATREASRAVTASDTMSVTEGKSLSLQSSYNIWACSPLIFYTFNLNIFVAHLTHITWIYSLRHLTWIYSYIRLHIQLEYIRCASDTSNLYIFVALQEFAVCLSFPLVCRRNKMVGDERVTITSYLRNFFVLLALCSV
jgi:hypothetical protein